MINLLSMTFLIGIVLVAVIAMLIFWIWAIVDCIKSDSTGEYKLLWLLIIIFLNIIGAILYFLFSGQTNNTNLTQKTKGKRLMRSSEDRVIAGVCGGVANYFEVDSAVVRIIWVLLTIFVTGSGFIVYLIAAIAMPSDRDIVENKKNKKQTKDKTEKPTNKDEKIKNLNTKSELKNKKKETKTKKPLIYIGIGLLVIFIIITILVSAFISYDIMSDEFKEDLITKDINVQITDRKLSEKIIIEKITSSANYKNYEGYDLILVEIREPEREKCSLFQKDPYGLRIYDSGCREYVHKFSVREHEEIKEFSVTTLVIREKITEMTFREITKNESELKENNEEQIIK